MLTRQGLSEPDWQKIFESEELIYIRITDYRFRMNDL